MVIVNTAMIIKAKIVRRIQYRYKNVPKDDVEQE
jgi:hypothetical protein